MLFRSGVSALLVTIISPYIYDYDMTATGIGLAFLAKDLYAKSKSFEKLLFLCFSWFVCGGPLIVNIITQNSYTFALSGFVNWLLFLLTLLILFREPPKTAF